MSRSFAQDIAGVQGGLRGVVVRRSSRRAGGLIVCGSKIDAQLNAVGNGRVAGLSKKVGARFVPGDDVRIGTMKVDE